MFLTERIVLPEWLDTLPPSDPGAIKSRQDLRRLNWWMAHGAVMERSLRENLPVGKSPRLIELGAGDGTFLLNVARRLSPRIPRARVTLVDRAPCVSEETIAAFEKLGWTPEIAQADVFDWLEPNPPTDAIMANLFLHHFQPEDLCRLLSLVATRCRLFVACEPKRDWLAWLLTQWIWAIGCNRVTRHDAEISVRAGFNGQELSTLWPRAEWQARTTHPNIFTHLFVAVKQSAL